MALEYERNYLRRLTQAALVDPASTAVLLPRISKSRAALDEFFFRLIAFPIGDGTWDAVNDFLAFQPPAVLATALKSPTSLPDSVLDVVNTFIGDYPTVPNSDDILYGHRATDSQQGHMLSGLVTSLASDKDLRRAGLTVHVNVTAARIRDKAVGAGVGAYTWASIAPFAPTSWAGTAADATKEIVELANAWETDPKSRTRTEENVLDLARSLTWRRQ